jgi:ribosome maturation factor RimP
LSGHDHDDQEVSGTMTVSERIRDIVAPLVDSRDMQLYDLDHGGGVVRVVVQRDTGIDLDDIAALTRDVSRAFDEHDPVPGTYTLEVTTPGLERALRVPAHFVGAVGEQVRMKLVPAAGDDRRVDGTVVSADDHAFTVRSDAGDDRRLPYDQIERARTVFDWGPGAAPKPKRKKKT